jgi:outer membrane protein OmpA-like peptidoglycan-associated protein
LSHAGSPAQQALKRPHDAQSLYGISPWLDAEFDYVRTGPLNRPGFDVAAGLAVPVGESRSFWLGPFVRYMDIIQPARVGFDNSNAQLLTVGISLEVGNGIEREPQVLGAPPAEIRTVIKEVIKEVPVCADRDNDGVPDASDRCPDVKGPMDNWGCPKYEKLVVGPNKLELKEKLYFAFDQDTLEAASFPVMDEVVKALQENKGFRVQVDGHTDSTGPDAHNQSLSERRAGTVVEYLVQHGISRDRLSSKGFAASEPLDTNKTVEGRENNRRVEFVVNFLIVNDTGAKP